jgi:hypothetical protein
MESIDCVVIGAGELIPLPTTKLFPNISFLTWVEAGRAGQIANSSHGK